MKAIIYTMCVICALIEIVVYIDLKKFLKAHGEEIIENNIKGLRKRCVFLFVVPIVLVVLAVLLNVIN